MGSIGHISEFDEWKKNIESGTTLVMECRANSSDPLWTEMKFQSERTSLSLHHAKYEPYPLSEIVMDDYMIENLRKVLKKFQKVSYSF